MTKNVNLRKQTHFSSKCGHIQGIKSLAKNPGHLRDSQKGMTSPKAKNRPSPALNHHRIDMTQNVNLRKQTHFPGKCRQMPNTKSLTKTQAIYATAKKVASPPRQQKTGPRLRKGQNEPNSPQSKPQQYITGNSQKCECG